MEWWLGHCTSSPASTHHRFWKDTPGQESTQHSHMHCRQRTTKCSLSMGHGKCSLQADTSPSRSLLQSYLLRGPVEQAPVPQGFVSCGILIHFVIGVRWEPHLEGSDRSHGAGSYTDSPGSPSNMFALDPWKQAWDHHLRQSLSLSPATWCLSDKLRRFNPWARTKQRL